MWLTDTQIARIPALAGISPEQVGAVGADARRLYEQIELNPATTDQDLRSWGEGAGIPPERFNAAITVLQRLGKVASLDAVSAIEAAPDATASDALGLGAGLVPADVFSKDELRAAVDRLKLDVPKSATKDDLVRAIAEAPRP